MEPQPTQQLEASPSSSPTTSLSRSSSRGSFSAHRNAHKKGPSLSLDLSSLPPLEKPAKPSNTLIFTNLNSLDVFAADNLQTIRDLVLKTAPIHAWCPLRSFRRIIVSFFDEDAAIAVRQVWDGEAILGERCRVYFGKDTPISPSAADNHLALPDQGKLFFISPPPSPPHGWEVKLEDAPNKLVHAEDLADALAKLRHHNAGQERGPGYSPVSPTGKEDSAGASASAAGPTTSFGERKRQTRSRSSTLIFQPLSQGAGSPELPCVTVDDMTDEPEGEVAIDADGDDKMGDVADEGPKKTIFAHTARPPVELMHEA